VIVLLSALALAVPPPSVPGQWHQLGAPAKSKPGKQVHFFRTAISPTNLGIVVKSLSRQPIRVYWWTYCEFESDDASFEEHHQTITGTRSIEAYPPVLSGATLCYVSVNAGAAGRAAVSAAVFDN
jgi:hypothetical protein